MPRGFPDWQQIVQWIGPAAFRSQTVNLDGSGNFSAIAQVASGSYRGALVRVAPFVTGVWVTVSTVVDDVGGLIGFGTPVYVPPGTVLVFATDLWAQEVTVSLSGTANAQVGVGVWPTNLPPGCYGSPFGSLLLNTFQNVGAGGSLTLDFAQGFFGDANVCITGAPSQAFAVSIHLFDQSNADTAFIFQVNVPAGTVGANYPVYLPPGRLKLNLFNFGAAASNIQVSVIGKYNLAPAP